MSSFLRVLGCSGGIGKDLRTTSFLLNETILIDAGTGVGDLTVAEMSKIDHVFLTHSHLDHICSIPLLLDTVGVARAKPLTVFGIQATIDALRTHIFNNVIWPDFSVIPTKKSPCLRFEVIGIKQKVVIAGVSITSLPVSHSIAASGYWIDSGSGAVVFSGDTKSSTDFWDVIHRQIALKGMSYLKDLIIETSFTNLDSELAALSGHYYPTALIHDLAALQDRSVRIWITHLKPGEEKQILQELGATASEKQSNKGHVIGPLRSDQILSF